MHPSLSRFITNLIIQFSGTGLVFMPPQLQVYLGDFQTQFQIGAQKNLQEKVYPFNILMQENYYKEFYNIANSYVIFVSSQPVSITIPQNHTVPIGGCSLPVLVQVPKECPVY